MTLPRPSRGTRQTFLLVLLALLAGRTVFGIEIGAGNLIVADRTADPFGFQDGRGSLMLVDPAATVTVRLIASPNGFVNPVATLILEDGTVLCVDADAQVGGDTKQRGVLWLIDPTEPLPGRAVVFASSNEWVNPIDILEELSGDLLLLDSDADPLAIGNMPGALYRIGRTTQEVTLIASHVDWVDPLSITYDIDGSLLVWDMRADPNHLGTAPGALFRVNPTTGGVDVVFSVDEFLKPIAVAVDGNGDYLVVDREANPGGHSGDPGAVFRVSRASHSVQPVLYPSSFVDPVDLLLDPSGDVWVLDQRANPFNLPTATGAVFRCNLGTGAIVKTIASGFFRDPAGLSQFSGTALDSSVVVWTDPSGPPLQPGDRMRVHVRPRNTGSIPGRPVNLEHLLSPDWDFRLGSDSSSHGEFAYDPFRRVVSWSGDIEVQGEASIAYEIRLNDQVPAGTALREKVVLRVGRTSSTFNLDATVVTRSAPGRVVWADYRPGQTLPEGRILEMPQGATVPSVVYDGAPFVQPDDVVFLEDGTIVVLDRRSRPLGGDQRAGGIYRIDPLDGSIDTLLIVADHPELPFPAGLANGGLGKLLLIDKDANPNGLPGLPGAIFSFEIETGGLEVIASDTRFSEPSDAILETTGLILMVDFDADPFGTSPRGGAIFEVDPATGSVEPIEVPAGTFVDPIGLAEGTGRRIYVADLGADPNGIGGNTGAIFEIIRTGGNYLLVASADSIYVDPTDVFLQDDGTLIVTDRDANPFNLSPRDRGAVFRVRPHYERPRVFAADPSMYGPEAVAGFVTGNLGGSRLDVFDVNGPPTRGGDTLRFEAVIGNRGRGPVPEAMATVVLSSDLALLGAEGPGEVVVDPGAGVVSWLGPVSLADTVRVEVRARVEEGLLFGDRVFGLLDLSGPGSTPIDSAVVTVVAPLGPGDMVLVDTNADPHNLGNADGALYLLRSATKRAEHLLQTDPDWIDPIAIEQLDTGRFLVADSRGAEHGAIYIADYLLGSSEPFLDDPRLGAPSDLFWNHNGDLLVVDPVSNVDPERPRRPVVLILRSGEEELSVLTDDEILSQPTQIAEDDAGRFWLVDRQTDPNGAAEGRGALFQIDLATGAILDTLQFPEFLAPSGIVNWPGEGLVVVDEISRAGATGFGAIFRFDPQARTLALLVADPRFRQPHSGTFAASGELWIVDRLARDETQPGAPRTLFRWDPETDQVETVAAAIGYVTPSELFAMPGPNPRLSSYRYEDIDGPPLEPGDQLTFRARVENIGPIETLAAAYRDTLPAQVRLEMGSVRADAGIIEFPEGINGLIWTVNLPPGSSYEVRYTAQLHPGIHQGTELKLRSHLRTGEGVHRVRRIGIRVPVFFEDGYLYIADADADPFTYGGSPGALLKVQLSTGGATAMSSSPELSNPVDALAMPTIDPNLLLVDSDASPLGDYRARGCLWRWNPDTEELAIVAADSSFRSPRCAVPINDHEVLLLDARADPFDLRSGLGPGAVYRVDVETGEVEPFASDTLLTSPVGLILDGLGGAFVIDPDADPAHYGLRNGAVFRLDLGTRRFSIYATSADFRGPVAGTLGPDGTLYILDRDVTVYPNSEARGAVFRVDPFGNVSLYASSMLFRRLHDIAIDMRGRMIVSDREADPRGRGSPTGAIFRLEVQDPDFRILSAYVRFVEPSGFFLRDDLTAIEITGLEATPREEGILVRWRVPDAQFVGFLCLRAEGTDRGQEAYRVLNEDDPVPGRGPWEYLDLDLVPGEVYSYQIVGILPDGGERFYGPVVAVAPARRPFALLPPAPNPVRGETSLRFDLPRPGKVGLRIYDLSGRSVRVLQDHPLPAGRHTIPWDGRDDRGHPVASGLYFVRLVWTDRTATGRLVLLR